MAHFVVHAHGFALSSLTVTALVSLSLLRQEAETSGPRPDPPPAKAQAPKPQPIPFSHKQHTALGLKCADCHPMPPPGWQMTFPAEEKCMQCHESVKVESPAIVKLAQYYNERKPVPWVQIYRLPDYVLFSHKRHHQNAGIACEDCHGPVSERDVVVLEKSISMATCVDCHAERGARTNCRVCHNR